MQDREHGKHVRTDNDSHWVLLNYELIMRSYEQLREHQFVIRI
jgi:hypothetical protein